MSHRLAALVALFAVSGCTWETRPDGDSPRHLDAARAHPVVSPETPEAVEVADSPTAPNLTTGETRVSATPAAADAATPAPAGTAPTPSATPPTTP